MNKQKIMIIGLSLALFFLGQYILYEKITESRQKELTTAFENGYKKGLTDTTIAVYKQTENCQPTSVTIGNLTKNVFDLSCLKSPPINMTR